MNKLIWICFALAGSLGCSGTAAEVGVSDAGVADIDAADSIGAL